MAKVRFGYGGFVLSNIGTTSYDMLYGTGPNFEQKSFDVDTTGITFTNLNDETRIFTQTNTEVDTTGITFTNLNDETRIFTQTNTEVDTTGVTFTNTNPVV